MVNRRVYVLSALLSILLSSVLTFLFLSFTTKNTHRAETKIVNVSKSIEPSCSYKINRVTKYAFIKPLLFGEKDCEALSMQSIKKEIQNKIDQYKKEGVLISASVYLREFERGDWMCINDTETYYPGSLIKVVGMLSYLKLAEEDPSILNKKYVFQSPSDVIPNQTFSSKEIEHNKSYDIKQLLKYMVSYSDNNATYLLNKNVNQVKFLDVFRDLSLPVPDMNKSTMKFTIKDYSAFFKILYNAGYLTIDNSEFALELLADCDFKYGFAAGVPSSLEIAHKFGEAGDISTRQLHETGIFYLNNKPYLLSVFTKGYDIKALPQVLKSFSAITYKSMADR
jgi:beta-lactamase class A